LEYFWTKDGGSNITVSVDGQEIKSYDDLLAVASQERYKKMAFIDVGLFLSNEGKSPSGLNNCPGAFSKSEVCLSA